MKYLFLACLSIAFLVLGGCAREAEESKPAPPPQGVTQNPSGVQAQQRPSNAVSNQ